MKKTIKHLEKQIISIGKIKKITTAMKIIATIKTKKTTKKITDTLIRKETINEIFAIVFELAKLDMIQKKLLTGSSQKKLWIIFSSDLGLCGAFNSKLFQTLPAKFDTNDHLIIVGMKGIKHFQFQTVQIVKSIPSNQFLETGMSWLLTYLEKNFLTYRKINIVYHQYQAMFPIPTTVFQLHPIVAKPNQTDVDFLARFILEDDPWSLFLTSLPFYWESLLTLFFWNSRASEEKTRQFAMDNASSNATDIVKDLTLQFNRLRQEKITKEILLVSQED